MSVSMEAEQRVIELRCDAGALLGKMIQQGEQPQYIKPDNLIELNCLECKKLARRQGRLIKRVLHRYTILGELVETLEVR